MIRRACSLSKAPGRAESKRAAKEIENVLMKQISGTNGDRRGSSWLGALLVVVLFAPGAVAHAQAHPEPSPACVLQKDLYQCDWLAFKGTFDAARSVSVQSEPMDGHAGAELASLAGKLGKHVVARTDQPADLTFLMIPLNKNGIYIGPGEENLGTLRIYTGRTASDPGTLVWAETYRGTKDIPWPSVEFYLMQQFRARLKS
jgi:hypothetical protein